MSSVAPYLGPVVHRPRTRSASRGLNLASWFTLPFILWAMLWLSINTGPWNFADFGTGFSGSVNAIRAGFPLVVYAVAFFSLGSGKRKSRRNWAELGFWIYGLVMLFACTGAQNWFEQAYWGFAFLATLAVVERGLRGANPLEFAVRLNWLSWVVTTAALVTMLFLARNVLYDPNTNSAYGLIDRFQDAYGYTISRETGLSRMAAIPAIVSLAYLFSGRAWQRLLSVAVFVGSAYIIWIMQSRGALFSFVGAFLFVILAGQQKEQKIGLMFAALLVAAALTNVLTSAGIHDLWMHATRDTGMEGIHIMSGRDLIWQDALRHWSDSPLIGYGPQADRLFDFNAQNAVIYALLCAGAVGAAAFVAAMVASWRALLSLLSQLRRLSPKDRTMVEVTGAILVFSTLRSYPENQAAVFSVDLLLQYPAMVYLVVLWADTTPPQNTRGKLEILTAAGTKR